MQEIQIQILTLYTRHNSVVKCTQECKESNGKKKRQRKRNKYGKPVWQEREANKE